MQVNGGQDAARRLVAAAPGVAADAPESAPSSKTRQRRFGASVGALQLRVPSADTGARSLDAWDRSLPAWPTALRGRRVATPIRPPAALALAALDLVVLAAATAVAMTVVPGAAALTDVGAALVAYPAVAMALLAQRGLYGRRRPARILDTLIAVGWALSFAAVLVVGVGVAAGGSADLGQVITHVWPVALLLVGASRSAVAVRQAHARRQGKGCRRTLIVGAGRVGMDLVRRLRENPEYGLMPVGLVDGAPSPMAVPHDEVPILGSAEDLIAVAREVQADHVILAFSQVPDGDLTELTRRWQEAGLSVSVVPRLFESLTERTRSARVGALPLLELTATDPRDWRFSVKYAIDRCVAAGTLLVLAPLLLVIAALVKLNSPGPVLFRQRRVGMDGQVFDLLKFRSMREAEPDPVVSFLPRPGLAPGGVEGVDRRTTVGRLLRRTSLDELPQLINVLRGEMSLVGPRPERPEFVELFGRRVHRYDDRHRVKSGITGWAQVNGLRGQTSLRDRIEYDNFYIENWSFWLDAKVVALTLWALKGHSEI